MPGPPLEIRSNDSRQRLLLDGRPIRHVVGGDERQRAVGQAVPQRVAGCRRAERRRDDVAGRLLGRQRRSATRRASGSAGTSRRTPACPAARAARTAASAAARREVDDVQRRVGRLGQRDRPARSPRPRRTAAGTIAWKRGAVSPAARWRAVSASRIVRFSQWTSSMPPRSPARASSAKQRRVVDAEVVDHERLERRHARLDQPRHLGDRVRAGAAVRTSAQARSRPPSRRRSPPATRAGPSRATGPLRRRARARVVERQERRRAAERRRDRVLEEPVGLRRRDATRVWVWTSTTPGRTSRPVASTTSRADAASPPRSASTAAIRPPSTATSARREPVDRDDRAAADRRGPSSRRPAQPSSTISISWAPSHRQRRPTSRSRSSQPSSGRTVAKWLAASWPTFDDVAHAPYGKKISHSLMPPGIERELARRRVRGVVLPADVRPQVAVRDPGGLAAPAAVDEPGAERQHRPDDRDRLRRLGLPAGAKVQVTDADRQIAHRRRIPGGRTRPTISTHVLDTGIGRPAGRRDRPALAARPVRRPRDARGRGRDRRRRPGPRPAGPDGARGRRLRARRSTLGDERVLRVGHGRVAGRPTRRAATTCRCWWRRSGCRPTGGRDVPDPGSTGRPGRSTTLDDERLRGRAGAAVRGCAAVPGPARRGAAVRRRRRRCSPGRATHRPRDARGGAARADRRPSAARRAARLRVGALVRGAGLRHATRPMPRRRPSARASPPSSTRLNDAYEARFGFRYCVFVAGRPRAALLPGMEAALDRRPRR